MNTAAALEVANTDPYLVDVPAYTPIIERHQIQISTLPVPTAKAIVATPSFDIHEQFADTTGTSLVRDQLVGELRMLQRVNWENADFMTLRGPSSVAKLQECHDRLRRVISAYDHREPVEYVVVEAEPFPHLHSLIVSSVDPSLIEDMWSSVIRRRSPRRSRSARGFPSAHVDRIHGFGALRYCVVKTVLRGHREVERSFLGPWPTSSSSPWPSELRDPEGTARTDPVLRRLAPAPSSRSPGRPLRELLLAESFLIAFLEGGPRASVDVFSAARSLKMFSARTLNRAKKLLGIARVPGTWCWALPRSSAVHAGGGG